jgi:hypothetical protein
MNALKNKIAQLAEYDVKNHASFLKWTTLIIWACSLVAEVGTFAYNDKLPKKEKHFIIQQELVAGGLSLAMMYLLADRFQKAGEWLVRSGKLLPAALPVAYRTKETLHKLLILDKHFIQNELKGETHWCTKLLHFQKGASVILGTLGTIFAFNITSPLISNKIASATQNHFLKKTEAESHQGSPSQFFQFYAQPLSTELSVPAPPAVKPLSPQLIAYNQPNAAGYALQRPTFY